MRLNYDWHIHWGLPIKAFIASLWAWLIITASGFVWVLNGVAVFPPDKWNVIEVISSMVGQFRDVVGILGILPLIIIGIFALVMFSHKIIVAVVISLVAGFILSPDLLGFILDMALYFPIAWLLIHLLLEKNWRS